MTVDKELVEQIILEVGRLASSVDYREDGGYVEVYASGRYFGAPLPYETNSAIMSLLSISGKLKELK